MQKPYHLLYPMRVVLVTSKHDKRENVMTAAWCFPLSMDPPLFGVSISKKRFSYSLISKEKSFAINLADGSMRDFVIGAGRTSGKDMGKEKDKFVEFGIEKEYGKLGIPLVKKSPSSIECKVVEEIELGDHVVFVGEAVNIIYRREGKGLYHKGGDEFFEI